MRVLILGGTVFLGRHLVDAALDRGDEVTLFHRGRHAAHRPQEVEELLGDRDRDLHLLAGRDFDAVVDTCGYLPRHVAQAAGTIRAGHYTFVSSASVYAELGVVPVREDAPLLAPPGAQQERVDGPMYGPQKAGCEQALLGTRSDVLIQRVGLLVGPHDPTDRLTYWAVRMRRPGPVLAPAAQDQPVQVIDVRDLAAWTLHAAASGTTGVMNASSPLRQITFERLLRLAGPAEVAWFDEQVLLDVGVTPWTELPLWLPERYGMSGLMALDTRRARAAGLRTRPIEQTLADTAAWADIDHVRVVADYGTRARSAVLTAQREAALLAELSPAERAGHGLLMPVARPEGLRTASATDQGESPNRMPDRVRPPH